MKRSANRKNTAPKWRQYALIVLVALVLPLGVNAMRLGADSLSAAGERLASVGAVLNMPGEGLAVLIERFQDALYPAEEAPADVPAVHLPGPVEPSRPEKSPAEEDLEASRAQSPIQPRIPLKYRAQLVSESFSGREDAAHILFGAGLIRNTTSHKKEDVEELLATPMDMSFSLDGGPLVLIYHTHATESFERYDATVYDTRNTWRSNDNNNNMVAVGAAMAKALEEAGIPVIHDTTQHDNPSYNGSYEKSAETIAAYLEEYPGIKIVLDLHRDAMERENSAIIKPVAEVGGKKAAQIMIIAGCDDGTMNMPNWRENLRFAAAYQNVMERDHPGLTRPILFSYRKYNQDLSPGGILMEFGSNANTLDEAIWSAQLAGEALAALIHEHLAE